MCNPNDVLLAVGCSEQAKNALSVAAALHRDHSPCSFPRIAARVSLPIVGRGSGNKTRGLFGL